MGKFVLLPAEPKDAEEMLALQCEAFGGTNPDPFWEQLYPKTESRDQAVKRFLDGWLADANAKYLKVVDEDSGEIVSTAKWGIYQKPFTEAEMNARIKVDFHPDEDMNEWSEHTLYWVRQHRLGRTKGAPCVALELMASHPSYQKRGAGSMAVKWGTNLADSLGLECFVEATDAGRPLYEKWGFVANSKDRIIVPVPEKWKGRPEVGFYFYQRAAIGRGQNGEVEGC